MNGYLQVGNNAAGGYGTININSGGTLTFTNQTGNPNSIIGQQGTGGTSYLNVNGGVFNWDGTSGLFVGNGGGSGELLITNGGTATILKGTGTSDEGYLAFGRDGASSSGTLYLANGTLATDRIICQGSAAVNGTGYVFFDGGTLKALANQTDWLQSVASGNAQPPSAVTINAGAAVVDANGFSVAINNALASGASPDGGLVLIDSSIAKNGVLTLGGASGLQRRDRREQRHVAGERLNFHRSHHGQRRHAGRHGNDWRFADCQLGSDAGSGQRWHRRADRQRQPHVERRFHERL